MNKTTVRLAAQCEHEGHSWEFAENQTHQLVLVRCTNQGCGTWYNTHFAGENKDCGTFNHDWVQTSPKDEPDSLDAKFVCISCSRIGVRFLYKCTGE